MSDDSKRPGAAIVSVSVDVLAKALKLPPGVTIMGLSYNWNGAVELALHGPGLPVVERGRQLPHVMAVFERRDHGEDTFHSFYPYRPDGQPWVDH